MRPLRALLLITLTTGLALGAQAQEYWVVGKFLPGPVAVYSVSASGEIALVDTTIEGEGGEKALVDPGGRLVLVRESFRLLLYRIEDDHTLTLVDTVDAPSNTWYSQSIALSQDGRMALILFADNNINPRHYEFRTLLVNNRLQLVETGHVLDADGFPGLYEWTISDFDPYRSVISLTSGSLMNMPLSGTGIIGSPEQELSESYLLGAQHDLSADGRWDLRANQVSEPNLVLVEMSSDGVLSPQDAATYSAIGDVWDCELWPNLQGVIAGTSPRLFSIRLNPDMTFGEILDSEVLGFGFVGAVGVSHDGTMVLACDQAPGFDFPLFSYFLNPDTGELTSTGHTLSRPDHHADLRFIPPPTLPTLPGDANVDGVVDAADLTFLVNEAMPDDKPILYPQNFANADFDNDIDVDEDDLNALIGLLLGL